MKLLTTIFFFIILFAINSFAQTPGTLKWEFETSGDVGSAAIGPDGTIYVGTISVHASYSGSLYAFNPDGTKKWEKQLGTTGRPPVIGSDGTVFISARGKLHAINPDGTTKWDFNPIGSYVDTPTLGYDGTIYIGTGEILYALNPDGTIKWEYETEGGGSPVIGPDGTFYVESGKKLYALNPDGTIKWKSESGSYIGPPALDSNGTIYIGSGENKFYAFNPDGTIKWEFQTGGGVRSSPVIGGDGTIYLSSSHDKFYAVNPDGTKKWEFQIGIHYWGAGLAVGSDGTIYVGSDDHRFYAINPNGTKRWEFETGNVVQSSPVIASDGTVYIGSDDNKLYALHSESAGLADSPWPKFRKNNQNVANSFNENCPVAKVVDDYFSTQSGGQVILDGSPSYDPDGDDLTYLWRVAEKPQGSSVVLTDSTSAVITVDIPSDEHYTYRFALTITDNDDGYSSASVYVSTAKKWEFKIADEVRSSPAIGPDSTVYIASYDGNLYAVNPDGSKKWEFGIGGWKVKSSPAVASDGTVYIGVENRLYAVYPDGSKKWEFPNDDSTYSASSTGNSIDKISSPYYDFYEMSSPAVASDGTIYIGYSYYSDRWNYSDGTFYAVNSDGTLKWMFDTKQPVPGSPVIGPDGTVYFGSGSYNGSLYAFNPDGSKKWEFQPGGGVCYSAAINADGIIYSGFSFPSASGTYGKLYALNPDGSKIWEFKTVESIESSPAIASDGTIYLSSGSYHSDYGSLYAINPDGTKIWETLSGDGVITSPAIGSDGTIFIGSVNFNDSGDSGKFCAINPDGSIKWEFETGGSVSSSPAIASDGTVLFGSTDGRLYAVYSESGGLADSPWPKFRKNNRNTANSFNENCPVAKVVYNFLSVKNSGKVTLDGSPSYDPDGDGLSYLWCITEKPQGSTVALTDSTSAKINVNIPTGYRGLYSISLRVTDNDDGSSWTLVIVSTEMKWVYDTDGSAGSPATGMNGTVYTLSHTVSGWSVLSRLLAIDSQGNKKWEFQTDGWITSSPAIGADSTIYFGVGDVWAWYDMLYALNPDGSVKWSIKDSSSVGSSPAIDSDRTIYVSWGDKLCAINPDSTKKWEFKTQTGSRISGAPAINSDGTIYIASGTKLFAVHSGGTKKWEFESGSDICSSPVIGAHGTVYICSADHKLYAVNPDNGTRKWEFESAAWISTSPVIAVDGTVYIGAGNCLYAVNPADGIKKWEFEMAEGISSTPSIGSDNIIYFGSQDNKFFAVNPNGTEKWVFETEAGGNSSAAIDSAGTIYFGSSDGNLYAIYSESKGLANSPWPKFRHDNRNTGNVKTLVSIKEDKSVTPQKYTLYPMYPNHFNPATHVKFSLPKAGKVEINVFNILGQKVAKLLDAKKSAGVYDISWDASRLSSGMYFIRFESGRYVKVRKCLLLK